MPKPPAAAPAQRLTQRQPKPAPIEKRQSPAKASNIEKMERIKRQTDSHVERVINAATSPKPVESPLPPPQPPVTEEKKKRKIVRRPSQRKTAGSNHTIVFSPQVTLAMTNEISTSVNAQFKEDEAMKEWSCSVIEGDRVILKPSEDEITQKQKEYRKEYRERPENVEKRKEASKKPEIILKRKQYASRPDVILRKKIKGKEKRRVLKNLMAKHPDKYVECGGTIPNKRRKIVESSSSTSSSSDSSSEVEEMEIESRT
jgi:hypothetical protein